MSVKFLFFTLFLYFIGSFSQVLAQNITLIPDAVSFPDTLVGETSNSERITVKNTNSNVGTIESIKKVKLSNPNDFLITSDLCTGIALKHDETCPIEVAFRPDERKTFSAHLNVYYTNTQFEFATLDGRGVQPEVTLSTTIINFGDHPVGSDSEPHTVTVTNSGDGDLEVTSVTVTSVFSVSSETCTGVIVAPGEFCTIGVVFAPDALENFTGMVTIEDNTASGSQEVALAGVGIVDPAPAISLSANLNFGNQELGQTSGSLGVTLTNSGSAVLEITSISSDNSDFSESNDCPISPATLAVDGTCTITVTFTPSSTGEITGAIIFVSDASNEPEITLKGVGIEPDVEPDASFSTTSLDFGAQTENTVSAVKTITVTNSGTAPLEIDFILFAGDDPSSYAMDEDCTNQSVPISGTCTINVTFKPTGTGQLTATIVITDDAADSPQTVALTGEGLGVVVVGGGACSLLVLGGSTFRGIFVLGFMGLFVLCWTRARARARARAR